MWRKPRRSQGTSNCVEVDSWRKSGFSYSNGACVEVAHGCDVVGVRDTKQEGDLDRTVIEFSATAWRQFTSGLK